MPVLNTWSQNEKIQKIRRESPHIPLREVANDDGKFLFATSLSAPVTPAAWHFPVMQTDE